MRMTASWSRSRRPAEYKCVARSFAPNGELPSDRPALSFGQHRDPTPGENAVCVIRLDIQLPIQARPSAAGVRGRLVNRRSMLINGRRGLLAEFGVAVAAGPQHVGEPATILADPGGQAAPGKRIPAPLHIAVVAMSEPVDNLDRRIDRVSRLGAPSARRTHRVGRLPLLTLSRSDVNHAVPMAAIETPPMPHIVADPLLSSCYHLGFRRSQ